MEIDGGDIVAGKEVSILGLGMEEAFDRLRRADPAAYLSPSPDLELSRAARSAVAHAYSVLRRQVANPPALEEMLVDPAVFDAEQVWAQLQLLSQPLLSLLRRNVRRLQKQRLLQKQSQESSTNVLDGKNGVAEEQLNNEEEVEDDDNIDNGEEGEEDEEEEEEDEDEEEEEEDEDEEEGEGEDELKENGGVEDEFLKLQDLRKYLEGVEAEEYGEDDNKQKKDNNKRSKAQVEDEEDDDGEEEEEVNEDGDEEDGGFEFGDLDDDNEEIADDLENARYEDFFGGKKRRNNNKQVCESRTERISEKVSLDGSEYLELNGGQQDDVDVNDEEKQDTQHLSTYEKEQRKLKSKIEQMEKENIEPKSWTMQGEVTAKKRPKNSALEVDLDFEHNVRPAPVITEEVTASLEELIKKRIIEDQFDEVQRAPVLQVKAPKARQELDENKSKKGLAELYEEEYAQKAGLAAAPLSISDEQKKEASILFKKLCLKLDALSHFHFAPKPVIEDMSIQSNVPALAMEEIAPLAVSDAAMLAPEEIFEGKGNIKAERELTQAERKRRRANKKRKFKAEEVKRDAKKPRQSTVLGGENGREES